MRRSAAVARMAGTRKRFSSTRRRDGSIHRIQHEPERRLDSLRGVIGDIRSDGGTPSVESIATQMSGMRAGERAPVLSGLQQTHGNRYVQRVVSGIQAKLVVGQPGDKYEQEADRVADAVVQMAEPEVQRQVEPEEEEEEEELVQPKLAANAEYPIQRQVDEEEEEEEELLQTKELTGHNAKTIPNLESRIQAIRCGGQPLPESVRTFFEPRFGYDFSQVRIHTDDRAADAARAVHASAFTVGRNIAFAQGSFAPNTDPGQRLIAHELAHTLQQSRSAPTLHRRRTGEEAREERRSRRDTRSRRSSSTSDFCVPYATAAEARAARVWLDRFFSTVFRAWFGSETRDLWLDYLYGRAGTSRRVISGASSGITQGFQDSDTIEDYQENVLDEVVLAVASSCPTVPPNTWTAIPVATVVPGFNPNPPLNFSHATEIPGNIAGGISGSAFGTDSRHVSGNIRFFRRTDGSGNTTSVRLEADLDFIVRDAIDFCPGGAGAPIEQQVTVPLSRLEAMGWTSDLGYEVRFSGTAERRSLSRSAIGRCWSVAPPRMPIFTCFVAETEVTLPDRTTTIRIADLRPGQDVLAFDEQSGETRVCGVVQCHMHEPGQFLKIHFADGRVLRVTANHPIYSDGCWVAADDLRPDERVRILTSDGRGVADLPVEAVEESSRVEPLYDLTIADCHTFFAQGILVHNKM